MNAIASSAVFVAALYGAGATEGDRKKALAPYFAPKPGETIVIQPEETIGGKRPRAPYQIESEITIEPPKGYCFTITKAPDQNDIRLCKRGTIKFRVGDLLPNGKLEWMVSTGDGEAPTRLTWDTLIRQGRVVDSGMEWPGPSRIVYVYGCNAQDTFEYGRRIYLRLLSGERWVVMLPKVDLPMPQPPEPANLYIGVDMAVKKGVTVEDVKETTYSMPARLVYPKDAAQQKEGKWVPTWQTHPRNAYTMSADGFVPEGSLTPGMRGKCAYKYADFPGDPAMGLLECHDVQDYKWIYLPLACISDLAETRGN
jgi:hypothetical protein